MREVAGQSLEVGTGKPILLVSPLVAEGSKVARGVHEYFCPSKDLHLSAPVADIFDVSDTKVFVQKVGLGGDPARCAGGLDPEGLARETR